MEHLMINRLSAGYDNKDIIGKLDLSVGKGELAVILGPSGCGKSTLLNVVSGLLEPRDGEIFFEGRCLYSSEKRINAKVENRNIGFVFQDYALWPHMSVYGNITYPLKTRKYSRAETKKRVMEVLEMVGLEHKAHSYPGELSGGEKQRTALARVIAMNPALILMDEPLANIDAGMKIQLMKGIKDIQRELKSTMVYVTHDQSEAFEMADRMIVMKEGAILQEGTPREIYLKPENEFVAGFIGASNFIDIEGENKFNSLDCNKCKLCIRPENIRISGKGKFCGRIKRSRFKGQTSEHVLLYDDKELVVSNNGSKKFDIGDEVRFDIDKYHVFRD